MDHRRQWQFHGHGGTSFTHGSGTRFPVCWLRTVWCFQWSLGALQSPIERYKRHAVLLHGHASRRSRRACPQRRLVRRFQQFSWRQANTPTVFGNRLLARAANGGFNLGVGKNTTTASDWVWSTNLFLLNETVFLVGSYTFNTGSAYDDVAMLWLNPNAQDFAPNSAPPPTLSATAGADIGANQIASFVLLQQGLNSTNQPGAMTVDELRIGSSWASVTPSAIPEPILEAFTTANQVMLSWSTNAVGFLLETSATLNNVGTWATVATPYLIANGKFTVAQPLFLRRLLPS